MEITKHNWLITDAARHTPHGGRGVPCRHHGPPGPRPDRRAQGRLPTPSWTGTGPNPRRTSTSPGTTRRPRGTPRAIEAAADLLLDGRAARHLRRWRDLEGPRRGRAQGAGRADRHSGGHHPHGTGGLSRQPPALPRHARHARQLHGGHGHAAGPISSMALGTPVRRPGDRQARRFAPEAKVIHVDIDPAEVGKVRRPEVPIVGDCATVIGEILDALTARGLPHDDAAAGSDRGASARERTPAAGRPSLGPWLRQVREWQRDFPLHYESDDTGHIKPQCGRRVAERPLSEGHDRRGGGRAAPDVGVAVLALRRAQHLGQLRWGRDHGVCGPRRHRGQGGPSGPYSVGHRRGRVLPDDRAGAGDGQRRAHPGQGGDLEQRLPRNGPPVAGAVLRGALLGGLPVAGPSRLRQVGRGDGLRRASGWRRPRRSCRPSRRPTPSTTAPSWSTSGPTPSRRCSRWSRPAPSNDEIRVHPSQEALLADRGAVR